MKQALEPESGENRREAATACGRNLAGVGIPVDSVWTLSGDVVMRDETPGSESDPERRWTDVRVKEL
jgi:hypothetical protein